MNIAFWEAVRTTFAEIWAHKFRSFLTLFLVILGTMGVVVMVTMIEALKVMVWDGIKSLGFDGVMFVEASTPVDPAERQKLGLSRGLSYRDVAVLDESDSLQAVAAIRIKDFVVRHGSDERRARVYGITPSFVTVHDREISAGRWFDQGDEIERRRQVVQLADELLARAAAMGVPLAELLAELVERAEARR